MFSIINQHVALTLTDITKNAHVVYSDELSECQLTSVFGHSEMTTYVDGNTFATEPT